MLHTQKPNCLPPLTLLKPAVRTSGHGSRFSPSDLTAAAKLTPVCSVDLALLKACRHTRKVHLLGAPRTRGSTHTGLHAHRAPQAGLHAHGAPCTRGSTHTGLPKPGSTHMGLHTQGSPSQALRTQGSPSRAPRTQGSIHTGLPKMLKTLCHQRVMHRCQLWVFLHQNN